MDPNAVGKDVGDGELNCSPLVNMCSNLLNFGYADSRGFGILKTIWRQREGFVTLSVFGSLYFSLFFAVWVSLFWFVSANNQTVNLNIIHWALGFGLSFVSGDVLPELFWRLGVLFALSSSLSAVSF
jgi:hypothetical protein